MTTKSLVLQAIEIVAAGRKAEFARLMGMKPQMVQKIVKSGRFPAKHCKRVEILTGGRITADMLCPEVFAPNRVLENKDRPGAKEEKDGFGITTATS
jgi:DNA-binding transcriptional regulator YdaS (Cro superfamily)